MSLNLLLAAITPAVSVTPVVSVTSVHVAIAADTVATIATIAVAVSSVDGWPADTAVRAADYGNALDIRGR